jgi:Carboxypeptidase regulatory-like domain
MYRFLRVVLIGATMSAFTTSPAWAQATAELAGRVTDESGAVLPGVSVTVTQTDTGFTRTTVTDGEGGYLLPNLPTGPYRLEVALQGFRTYVQTGIVLQVGATPTINAALAVGNLEETVSVEAAAPLVDVRSAGISDVVENERIVELPLQGRQVTDLIVLAGAAVQTGTASNRAMTGGVNISVAGGLNFGVAYTLDGSMHNDVNNNANLPMPFPDALQEFSVATGGLSAQNGMHSGASVNAVTKSGTNSLHGNAFEFVRDKRFNATDPFAAIDPATGERKNEGLVRNQFGGTVGGPVIRDRLFFFGGYQGTTVTRTPAANITYIPTAAMLAGDFTTFASAACQGRDVALRGGFVNNRISPNAFSPAALNMAKRLPTTTDPCGQITYELPDDSREGDGLARADYQHSTNHSVFGRYMFKFAKKDPPFRTSQNVLTTTAQGIDNLYQGVAIGDTLVFGSSAVQNFRVTYNRTRVNRSTEKWFSPYDIGSNVFSYNPGEMSFTVQGAFAIGGVNSGIFNTDSYQISDDVTLVRGDHQLALGVNIAYLTMDFLTNARVGGTWTVNGQSTGLGLADFLLGRVSTLEHGAGNLLPMSMWYQGVYAQDTWRAGSRVTINAGLRWEPFFGQSVTNGAIYNWSPENFRRNVTSTMFLRAPAGLLYPGDEGFPDGKTGLRKQWLNFSPRVGLAWDLHGDGRTAVRTSYSIGYDFPTGERHNINAGAPPWGNRSLLQDPPGGLDDPYSYVGGDPHPVATSANTEFVTFGAFGATDPDINSPRTQSWNVTVEQQLGSEWGVSVSYLGSYSDRLWTQIQQNPAVFLGTGPCVLGGVSYPVCSTTANLNARRRLTLSGENPAAALLIGNMDLHTSIGEQTYRGLKLAARRRAASGIAINGNYTWSRCYGDDTTGGFPQLAQGPIDPDHPEFDRGHCVSDRTHVANISLGYETPDIGNTVASALFSRWRLSGIISARSGSWLNITTGTDRALNGQRFQEQRVNQVSDDVYGDKTLNNYLNRAAFAQPALGTFGNYERNSIRGPNFWTTNLAVSKLIPFATSQNVELRIEAFNLLNHFNWGAPGTNFNASTFGRIQTLEGEPRILQFGVKYAF